MLFGSMEIGNESSEEGANEMLNMFAYAREAIQEAQQMAADAQAEARTQVADAQAKAKAQVQAKAKAQVAEAQAQAARMAQIMQRIAAIPGVMEKAAELEDIDPNELAVLCASASQYET